MKASHAHAMNDRDNVIATAVIGASATDEILSDGCRGRLKASNEEWLIKSDRHPRYGVRAWHFEGTGYSVPLCWQPFAGLLR